MDEERKNQEELKAAEVRNPGPDTAFHSAPSSPAYNTPSYNPPRNNPIPTAPYYNGQAPTGYYGPQGPGGDAPTPWRDPMVQSAGSMGPKLYSPTGGSYGNAAPYRQEAPAPASKPAKGHSGFVRFLAAALACILLSGGSTAAVLWAHDRSTASAAPAEIEERATEEEKQPSSNHETGSAAVAAPSTDSVPAIGSATNLTVTGAPLSPGEIYDLACQQVVGVNISVTTNYFGQTTSAAVSGTGFIISEDGYIITNFHVVEYSVVYGYDITVLLHDESEYPAELVGYDEDEDLAVLKIDASGLTPVTIGSSETLRVGDVIYAVGNPLGELTYTMTDGIVSALNREISTSVSSSLYVFQTNVAVNSGNSGGPVYDTSGRVVGVVDAKYSDTGVEGLSFALPIDTAYKAALEIIEKGYVSGKAFLGITCRNVSEVVQSFAMHYYNIPDGVIVAGVNPGSAAEKAGLKQNDIITAVNGNPISSTTGLKSALRAYSPGDTITLTIYRLDDSKTIEVSVTLDEHVPEGANAG